MSHINISVNTDDQKDIIKAIALLQLIAGGEANNVKPSKQEVKQDVEPEEELDMSDLGEEPEEEEEEVEEETDDGLGDLLGDDEPAAPTIDDLKDAFKLVVTKKGKDDGTAFVKKVLKKLGANGMKEIAEDKREAFISVLTKFAKK